DAVARLRRVNDPTVADVDAHVTQPVEENEVARLERIGGKRPTDVPQPPRVVRQGDSELAVGKTDEARAVEPARAGTAPHIGRTEVPLRHRDDVGSVL